MPRWLRPGNSLRPRRAGGLVPRLFLVLVLLGATAFVAARLDPLPARFSGEARASDGDSFRVGRDRVRLTGFDAPELDQVCWRADGTAWSCGTEARSLMARLLSRGDLECRTEGVDRFDRTLARCAVGGEDIGAAMVGAGLAVSSGGYDREERGAREAARGIWSGRFTEPREWRDDGPRTDPGPGAIELLWNWFRELTGATALR